MDRPIHTSYIGWVYPDIPKSNLQKTLILVSIKQPGTSSVTEHSGNDVETEQEINFASQRGCQSWRQCFVHLYLSFYLIYYTFYWKYNFGATDCIQLKGYCLCLIYWKNNYWEPITCKYLEKHRKTASFLLPRCRRWKHK